MTRKTVVAAVTLALVILLAGCVSGGDTPTPKVVEKTVIKTVVKDGGGGNGGMADAPLIIKDEVVPGHAGFPENPPALVQACLPLETYAQGMQPAWHVWVIDPATGEQLTNETVDSVVVEVDNGLTVQTEFNTDDGAWHGCFVLDDDAATGELGYTVVAQANGETFEQTGSIQVVERGDL